MELDPAPPAAAGCAKEPTPTQSSAAQSAEKNTTMPALGILLLQPSPPDFLLLIPASAFRVLVSASMAEAEGGNSLEMVPFPKMRPLRLLRTGSCGLLPRGPLPLLASRSLSFLPLDLLGALVLINQDRASSAIVN